MPQQLEPSQIEGFLPEIAGIRDDRIREKVAEIWCEIASEMSWNDLYEVPKNNKAESNRMLIGHIRGVTQMAVQICEVAETLHGKPFDRDLLLAACLLHDASKPVEYEPDPSGPETGHPRAGRQSRLGKNIQHGVYAAHKILEKGLSLELANLVITHTHGSGVRGATWEAAALFYADFADTDAGLSSANARLYIQRWNLGA